MGVHDDAQQWTPAWQSSTVRQQGIVRNDRTDPDQNCIMLVAQLLHVRAGFITGDPTTSWATCGDTVGTREVLGRWRNFAVECHTSFQSDKWQAITDVLRKCVIERTGFFFEQAGGHLDSSLSKPGESASTHRGVRIGHARYNTFNSGSDDSFHARPCPPLMRARFQVDVERRTVCFPACVFDCYHFGVLQALVSVKSFTNNFACGVYEHDANVGIRRCKAEAFLG